MLGVAVWWWIGWSLGAVPEQALVERAATAWEQGAGRAHAARSDSATRASSVWMSGPSAFIADVQLGIPSQRQLLLRVEQPVALGLATRSWYRANADHEQLVELQARWQWVERTHNEWIDWWISAEIAAHLQAHIASIDAERQRFKEAVDEGLLAPADYADLTAESLAVQWELTEVQRQSTLAKSRLAARVGAAPYPTGIPLENVFERRTNPWKALQSLVERFPGIRATRQRAEVERQHARALAHEALPVLGAGVMWAPDETGAMRAFANLGVTVPLFGNNRADRRLARGAAQAASAEAAWSATTLLGQLQTEHDCWQALRDQLDRLQQQVLVPLRDREDRLTDAQALGLTSMDRWVRARRDRHEAEHQALVLSGELLKSTSRAALLLQMVEAS